MTQDTNQPQPQPWRTVPGVGYPAAMYLPRLPRRSAREGKAITTAEAAAICGKTLEATRKALRRAGCPSILARAHRGGWRTLWDEPQALSILNQSTH